MTLSEDVGWDVFVVFCFKRDSLTVWEHAPLLPAQLESGLIALLRIKKGSSAAAILTLF